MLGKTGPSMTTSPEKAAAASAVVASAAVGEDEDVANLAIVESVRPFWANTGASPAAAVNIDSAWDTL